MSGDATEIAIWSFINGLGWLWWGPVAGLSGCCLWALYKLPGARSALGKISRVSLFFALLLFFLSPFNTAFGPLAMPFLMFGLWGFLHRRYVQLDIEGSIPKARGASMREKVATILVEPPSPKR